MARHGQSIILASILALLSYVPFKIVAKSTLIFCGLVFVFDPIPPTSRILSLLSVVIVGILGKIERKWREGQEEGFSVPVSEGEESDTQKKEEGEKAKKDQ